MECSYRGCRSGLRRDYLVCGSARGVDDFVSSGGGGGGDGERESSHAHTMA